MGYLVALAGRLTGVPKIIFTVHGWPFNEDRSWVSRKILKIISWLNVLLSHKTIVLPKKNVGIWSLGWCKTKLADYPLSA